MMELALSPAPEMLSASDVATLLKVSRQVVHKRMAGIAPVVSDGVHLWPVDLFPQAYQQQLQFVRKRSGLWSFEDVLRQATPRWEPDFVFAKLPKFSQEKAYKVKEVMVAYFAVLDNDEEATQREAICAARSKWLEVFSEACNEKTIRRWVDKIEARGTVEHACISAYADRKATPHVNARLENRSTKKVPGELIRAFKLLCVQPNMNVTAAYHKLEIDWHCGREVPGIGAMTESRQKFPFKVTQLRKFKPSAGACQMGNQGIAAARRDTLPHITRTYANLRPCELYMADDTRVNVTVVNDVSGKLAELKIYVCMEMASRRIVGYVMREGNMLATDVDALFARVFRTSGIAHPQAGYKTTVLFERGRVACSTSRQLYLESMFPGQLAIKRTSMDGGQNFPGDFVQDKSGHWMGKGPMESFMRTMGNESRHISGQRGSVYPKAPTMVGYPNDPHVGSMAHEALRLAQAGRGLIYLKSGGVDTAPHAREALEAEGIEIPLLFASQFRQAFALAIERYNNDTTHRREGFRQIEERKENGGLTHRPESSNERWSHLVWQAQQHGKAPQRISPADAAMLLHKARPVTITKQGAEITIDKLKYRYWHEDSTVCTEANLLTTAKKQYIALCDPDDLSEIHILGNAVSSWKDGDPIQFLECLPLYQKPDFNDPVAMGKAYEAKRQVQNRRAYELTEICGDAIQERTDVRDKNSKLLGVVTTTGDYHEVAGVSDLIRSMKRDRVKRHSDAPSPSRHEAEPDAIKAFGASLKGNPGVNP